MEDAERKSVAQASLLASSSTLKLKLQRREFTTEENFFNKESRKEGKDGFALGGRTGRPL